MTDIDPESVFPVAGGTLEIRFTKLVKISPIPEEHLSGAVRGCTQCEYHGWYSEAKVGKTKCLLFDAPLQTERVGAHVYDMPCESCRLAYTEVKKQRDSGTRQITVRPQKFSVVPRPSNVPEWMPHCGPGGGMMQLSPVHTDEEFVGAIAAQIIGHCFGHVKEVKIIWWPIKGEWWLEGKYEAGGGFTYNGQTGTGELGRMTIACHPVWRVYADDIARRMKGDRSNFLRWKPIIETMVVREPLWIFQELEYLIKHRDWQSRWCAAVREDDVGNPFCLEAYPASSGNLVHHVYWLAKFEEAMAPWRLEDLSEWVDEFGGGYGSMRRAVYRLAPTADYTIIDLPELLELQRWYLAQLGIPVRLETEMRKQKLRGPALFIATWSLSETPIEARGDILERVRGSHDAFLICYRDQFEGMDNVAAFSEWQSALPDIEWTGGPIPWLPGNSYLFGVRRDLEIE